MYASYRLSKTSEKTRVPSMAVLMIFASYLSTLYGFHWFWFYPLGLLSFPFSLTVYEGWGGSVAGYNIHFLSLKILTTTPQNAFLRMFSFFLSVNLVGAILGYWIDKRLLEESLKRKMFDFFFRSCFLSLIGCFLIFMPTLGYRYTLLNNYLNDNTLWVTLTYNVILFCIFYFWIPAAITTAIYGIYEWRTRHKKEGNRRGFKKAR